MFLTSNGLSMAFLLGTGLPMSFFTDWLFGEFLEIAIRFVVTVAAHISQIHKKFQ
jgi:hypothetical protein